MSIGQDSPTACCLRELRDRGLHTHLPARIQCGAVAGRGNCHPPLINGGVSAHREIVAMFHCQPSLLHTGDLLASIGA